MKQNQNQIKAGIVLSYVNMIAGNLIPLFYTPIMLFLLGQNEYGLYKLASSVSSYLSLFAFGIGGAITRYLIKAKMEGGKDAEENMFGMFHLIFQIIAAVTVLVGAIIVCNLGSFYSESLTSSELIVMKILVAIMVVNTAIGFSASSYNAVITSHERFIFLQIVNILSTIFAPLGNLVVLYLGFASVGMATISLAINVLTRFLYIIYVRKSLRLRPRFNKLPTYALKELLTFSFWVFVANIVSQLYNSTDTLIIGAIPALATVGVAVYNVGAVFNGMVFSLAQTVPTLFAPRVNKLVFSGASNGELTDLVIRVGRYQCYLVTLVCSGFVAFGQFFINWYVGNSYADAYWVAVVMMIPSCVPLVQSVALSITQAKNMHRFRSVTYLLIAIINVIGTYILVHTCGIIGAAAMTGAANILGQGFIMNWYYWKRVGLDIPRFWKNIMQIEWIPITMCVITLLISKIVDFYNPIIMCAGIVVYTTVYCLFVWIFAINKSEKELVRVPLQKIKMKYYKIKVKFKN